MSTRRQVSIFINGKEINNTIRSITSEKKKMNAELDRMVVGSEEYIKKIEDLRKVNGIIDDHRNRLSGVNQSYKLLTTGGLTKIAGLAAGAFSADIILSYGKHLFDLSGQMELLEQRARTVFGEVFPQVTAAAEKNAAAIGLTESQYINAATAIGDFLVPMQFTRQEAADMSTQLVNLSGALAEWEGGTRSAAEISNILSAALLGERERLKELGIKLSEEDVQNRIREKGLKNLTGAYAQQAEAIATIELITESSADAITAFANSSDTLARKQAALRVEITNISEKLSATLYPIFERLIVVAGNVVQGIGAMADGFSALINPAKAANDAFTDQATKVSNLEAELPPLLKRYEELQGKSNRTKAEQEELGKVIQRIGEITPGAITQIDEYGRVLSINANASRDFLSAEQARLKFLNKDAVQATQSQINKLKEQLDIEQKLVNTGKTLRVEGPVFQQKLVRTDATPEEIDAARRKVAQLAEEIKGAREQLKVLQGDTRTGTTAPAETNQPGANERLQAASGVPTEKERDKARKELEKHQKDIQEILEKFRLENYLATLDDDEKKIEQLRAKYDAEIDEVKKLEEKKVKGATEARIELERLKEEQITTLTNQLLQERYLKEEEAQKELDEKKAAAIGEKVAAELEARQAFDDQVNEFVLSEQDKAILELETHYQELLSLANKYGQDTTALERAYQDQKAAIRKEYADKARAEQINRQRDELTLLANSYGAYATIIGGVLQGLDGVLAEHTAASKLFSLAQIAFKTAEAIASGIAASAGVPFPANLGAIATTVATVLANFAAARKIFAEAPSVPQRYTGGFYDVQGQQDGQNYNAQYIGSPGTGLLPNRPVLLASERGQEYLVSNPDLQNPRVLNYVRAIENIRQSRIGAGGGVPQFADGGFAPGAAGSDAAAQLAPLLAQFLAVMGALNSTLEGGIDAKIADDAIPPLFARYRALNKASGGVL